MTFCIYIYTQIRYFRSTFPDIIEINEEEGEKVLPVARTQTFSLLFFIASRDSFLNMVIVVVDTSSSSSTNHHQTTETLMNGEGIVIDSNNGQWVMGSK
jgi:hypothetical protein